jgi:predicted 2-oxoglutarate/Fe(II)-dependent dioxygenase YbiX
MNSTNNWPDLLIVKQFFEPHVCAEILAELKAAPSNSSTVSGRGPSRTVDEGVRKSLRILPSDQTIELVTQSLLERRGEVEEHFEIKIDECEDPQFLHYRVGDFFVAHQDGNTGLLRLETEKRKISTIIFLSNESETPQADSHCGGSLVFSNYRLTPGRFQMVGEPGMLVAFRSETTHEITPLTHGERFSIASWYW